MRSPPQLRVNDVREMLFLAVGRNIRMDVNSRFRYEHTGYGWSVWVFLVIDVGCLAVNMPMGRSNLLSCEVVVYSSKSIFSLTL